MQIVYDSVITDADKLNIIRLANECGILYDTARLLYCKKIDTKEKITAFLNPSKKGFLNPFNLSGVSEAIDLIYNAKLKGLGVLIFGDYDADGVCATTIMKLALEEYGINANCVVPERHEGYGLNLEKIERLKQTMPIDLIITVDCGISDKDKIEVLKEWGITVIVTDHHEPPEDLPNCIKINPKLDKEKYGFTGLSGAGVAYKLSRALIGEKADKYLDFVAVSTIADSMELIDENRDLVAEGVKLLNDKKRLRKCFVPFLKEKNQKITASSLSYTLIPKINAGGRFGDAETVLKLFLSKDENEIFDLSSKLLEYNLSRQQEAEKIYLDARRKIQQENLAGDGIITLVSEEWQSGFVGLVASRLSDEFCRPIIVFGMQDGEYKGSARTYGEVNILEAITDSKHLLKTFGGHRQAAGLTVLKENFLALRKRLNEYMLRVYPNFNFDKQIHVEWKMESAPSMLFAKELECFEPFGVGNKKPIFSIECNKLNVSFIRSNNAHLNIEAKGFPLTYWKGGVDYEKLIQPINKELVFELETTEFQGKEWCRGIVRSVSYDYGDYSELKHYILENV